MVYWLDERQKTREDRTFLEEGSNTSKNFQLGAMGKSFLILLAHEKNQTPKVKNPKRMLAFAAASSLWATDKPAVYP